MKILAIVKSTGAKLEKVGVGAVHVVEVIGNATGCLEQVLTDASTLTPEVKIGLLALVKDGEALATGFVAAGMNPTNFVADAAAAADLTEFVKTLIAFLPVLKTAAGAVKADLA